MNAPIRSSLPAPVAALVGLLSVAAALGVGHLVAALVSPAASPFLAVGGAAIDLTPTPLKDFAVRTFGTYDKLVLLLGMAAVLGLFAVLAGLLARRSRPPGLVLLAGLGAVGGVAVLARPTAGALDVLAPLAALIVGAGVFVTLHRLARPACPPPGPEPASEPPEAAPAGADAEGVPRRRLLVGSAAV
ncbi:MAG TPA: molybdopterin-binding protein, partial [Pseudonocardiaceae bacterium]|nr:molybdopterin-binding protein [Pseudonocardiaceae bacterium]